MTLDLVLSTNSVEKDVHERKLDCTDEGRLSKVNDAVGAGDFVFMQTKLNIKSLIRT